MASCFVAGVDGCRAGWVCFKVFDSGETESALIDLTDVLQRRPEGLRALAIDIPIGLPNGPRACDKAARRLLGHPRGSSVFSAPCRATLSAVDHIDACRINEALTGKRISRQAWSITPKIKEVDDVIMPSHQAWVFEVHPEVCFWHLAGGKPMEYRKSRAQGREERLTLLSHHSPDIRSHLQQRPTGVASDDLLDAAAAAISARRWLSCDVVRVCKSERDCKGLRVEIVY
jgi:predicted RNase H-like nuclease